MNRYIIIAGVNGAGKSTLYSTMDSLKSMPRVNADEITNSLGTWKNPKDSIEAGRIAVRRISELLEDRITFNQETTLCGRSILRNIKVAKNYGYRIEVHYVCVDSVNIAIDRVEYRVKHGGHGVSYIDIIRRYDESIENLCNIINDIDLLVLYDNTKAFRRFAIYRSGTPVFISKSLPEWYEKIRR